MVGWLQQKGLALRWRVCWLLALVGWLVTDEVADVAGPGWRVPQTWS